VKPKRVISPAEAAAPVEEHQREQVWTFRKWRPASPVKFADGTTYQFPLQRLQNGGYDTSSLLDVSDPELAAKLRAAIKDGETTLQELSTD